MSLLWRLHQVHHTDLDVDLTTGIRFHPIEIILSALYKAAVVVALGADPWIVILFEAVLNCFGRLHARQCPRSGQAGRNIALGVLHARYASRPPLGRPGRNQFQFRLLPVGLGSRLRHHAAGARKGPARYRTRPCRASRPGEARLCWYPADAVSHHRAHISGCMGPAAKCAATAAAARQCILARRVDKIASAFRYNIREVPASRPPLPMLMGERKGAWHDRLVPFLSPTNVGRGGREAAGVGATAGCLRPPSCLRRAAPV